MTIGLQLYADAALTQPLSTANVTFDREIGGAAVDKTLYLGATDSTLRYEAADGGPMTFGFSDSDSATGWATTDWALSLTQAGLDTATAGGPVSINGYISGGVANAVPIWVRFLGTSTTPKTASDISIVSNQIREYQA